MTRFIAWFRRRKTDRLLRDAGLLVGTRAYQRAMEHKELT